MRILRSIIWLSSGIMWTYNAIIDPNNWFSYVIATGSIILCFVEVKNLDKHPRKEF